MRRTHGPGENRSLWVESLAEIPWPQDGATVAIVDQALPQSILRALDQAPFPCILVEAGEGLKTLARIGELAQAVLAHHASKPLTLIAVGGGSLGDAVGFLASILWRGVGLWHLPTTLLAMVDSAHGGKTAANLGGAKNQLGTFYPADKVVICAEVLGMLPTTLRKEGMAELVKGLWLGDEQALGDLDRVKDLADGPFEHVGDTLFSLLKRAVEVKYDVVRQDPFETKGIRTWLNFGHTVAHALELEFGISHGDAVSWGMVVAGELSCRLGEFTPDSYTRLQAHLEPLLQPLPGGLERLSLERFSSLLRRDKKREHGTLRSVLLHQEAKPYVTKEVSAQMWFDALTKTYSRWLHAPRRVTFAPASHAASITLSSSKSQLNRARLIQHLRPGKTIIKGSSNAEDVVLLDRALREMSTQKEVNVGAGGTTFRFGLVAAILAGKPVTLKGTPRLMARPHRPLYQAVERLGATVDVADAAAGVVSVRGVLTWPEEPPVVGVRCDQSSQYASALAMLSATGHALDLKLTTDEHGGFDAEKVVSQSYFEMTLEMLQQAGVEVTRPEQALVKLRPTDQLQDEVTLVAHPDESSAVFWRAAHFLGLPVEGLTKPDFTQADAVMVEILSKLAKDPDLLEVDLQHAPDLAPVLAALGVRVNTNIKLVNAGHVKHKESDRLEDVAAALGKVGIKVNTTEDGLETGLGIQQMEARAVWPTFEDHRLAMAGALLALGAGRGEALTIAEPWVVAKSYPNFWSDLRRFGGVVETT